MSRSTGTKFKRSLAVMLALCLCLISAAPSFAAAVTQTESSQELVIEEADLLDASQVAGEAIIGVTAAGRRALPAALAQTDIVLNDLMDVSDGVSTLSASEKKSLFGTSGGSDTCILMAAQSPTIPTDELIALLSACDGVLFAEENTSDTLTETETTESTIAGSDQTAGTTLAGTNNGQQEDTSGTSGNTGTTAYQKFQWFLKSGNFADSKSGVDLNIPSTAHGSKNTVIAVMDSGIDYNHPDLNDRMIDLNTYGTICKDTGCGQYGYNAVNAASGLSSADPMDDNNHGTHCAGIIAAEGNSVSGVMDNATLLAVKVSDADGHVNAIPTLLGFQWILKAKKDYGVNIAAVNFSVGGAGSKLCYKLSVAALDAEGITFLKAAGNNSVNMDITEYDNLEVADSTIVVDALNADGSVGSYSNYGNSTDVLAPGTNILSTGTEEDNKGLKFYAFEAAEKGTALAYTGFEGSGSTNENLQFTVDQSVAESSTDHYMTGSKSLNIKKHSSGTVTLTSNSLSLSKPTEKDVYFGLFCQDSKQNYVIVSLNTTAGFKKYALCVGTDWDGVHTGSDPWRETGLLDYGSFEKNTIEILGQISSEGKNLTVGSLLSGSAVKTLADWEKTYSNGQWQIDWENFQVQLEIGSIDAAVSQSGGGITIDTEAGPTGTLYLDDIGFGTDPDYYILETGTSMATPAVTGVYGLVYTEYGDKECNDKLSARITGSVKTDAKYSATCLTSGVVDATAALSSDESTFNPVLQSASVSGDVLTVQGWFLGEKGKVTINGTEAEILSFTADKNEAYDDTDNCGTIKVRIPSGISGEQVVTYTAASGKSGKIYTDVSPITTDFDEMTGSDLSAFESTYSAKIIEGSSGPEIYTLEVDSSTQKILAYDAASGTWKTKCTIAVYPGQSPTLSVACLSDTYYALATDALSEETQTSTTQRLYQLVLNEDGTQGTWQAIGEPIANQVCSLLTAAEGQLYIIGGLTKLTKYSSSEATVGKISSVTIGENGSVTVTDLLSDDRITADFSNSAAVKNGVLYFMRYEDLAEDRLCAFNLTDYTLTDYDLPVADETPASSFGLSVFGSGLIFTGKFNSTTTNVWFFDTNTGSWTASDLCLDSALSQVCGSVTVGHTAYVLGKSRNGNFWFVRTLDFDAGADAEQSVAWTMGSGEDAVFRINIPVHCFEERGKIVLMDGELINCPNDYTYRSGSTIITLKNDYLKTLSAGTHTMTVYFDVAGKDVAVNCSLVIAENPNVATGITGSDSGTTAAIALVLLAAVFGCVPILRRKTKC